MTRAGQAAAARTSNVIVFNNLRVGTGRLFPCTQRHRVPPGRVVRVCDPHRPGGLTRVIPQRGRRERSEHGLDHDRSRRRHDGSRCRLRAAPARASEQRRRSVSAKPHTRPSEPGAEVLPAASTGATSRFRQLPPGRQTTSRAAGISRSNSFRFSILRVVIGRRSACSHHWHPWLLHNLRSSSSPAERCRTCFRWPNVRPGARARS